MAGVAFACFWIAGLVAQIGKWRLKNCWKNDGQLMDVVICDATSFIDTFITQNPTHWLIVTMKLMTMDSAGSPN